MKNQINKIIVLLLKHFEIKFDNNSVYNLSTYVSVLYALLSQGVPIDDNKNVFANKFYNIISKRYKNIISAYEEVHCKIAPSDEKKICNILTALKEQQNASDEFILSDIYQQIKAYLLKQVPTKNNSSIKKKEGKHLLFQTQFFTDRYMVEYLVEQIFSTYDDPSCLLFVDPASGGGNFLAFIYRKLFNWYKSHMQETNIAQTILANNLLGFDLDSDLSEIANLSIFMLAYKTSKSFDFGPIFNFGGIKNDFKGFLNENVLSKKIENLSFNDILLKARKSGKNVIFLTNPPFMGKRDMDSKVKVFLQDRYPMAKGDMCFSFLLEMMRQIKPNDTIAVVAQNGWLNLSSLKDFRVNIIQNIFLRSCVDLGSNAFKNINGEKTNVVLAILQLKNDKNKDYSTEFLNLRQLSLPNKMTALKKKTLPIYSVKTSTFSKNKSYEFNYQFGNDLSSLSMYHRYGDFGKCMQGSSTGDNDTMVKYIWESNDPDWCLASKGGGFSKWQGLNIYKVKWGKDGECIKNNKGGVLRNPSFIPNTSLVFSDTGTLGLNVRIKLKNQVFIASGPGIRIISGDVLCHMAFLNSKIASFFMKIINPKFTISGGYIQKLPVADDILDNHEIKSLALLCNELKHDFLKSKLPNYEFVHICYDSVKDVDQFIEESFKRDMLNMHERLICERLIDDIVLSKYKLTPRLKKEYYEKMSGHENHIKTKINIAQLDEQLSKMLNVNCMPNSKKIEGKLIGSENCIEMLSYQTGIQSSVILYTLYQNVEQFNKTLFIYKQDFIHKILLKVAGINELNDVGHVHRILSNTLDNMFKDKYYQIYSQLNMSEQIIREIIRTIHAKVFFNHPIIQL